MKSYVFIAMVICSIIIYPFEAKSQDSGDLRIKSVTLVDDTGKATPQTVSASRACESIGGNIYLEWDRVYGVMLHAPGLNTWGKIIVESTNSAILGFFSCVEKVDPCNSITLEPYYG